MMVFCSALRFSFNRLVESEEEKELIKKVHALLQNSKNQKPGSTTEGGVVLVLKS